MAHIVLRPKADSNPGTYELFINGIDYSHEVFAGSVELVEVGEDEFACVGLRMTFAVSRLDLGGNEDLQVPDRFPEVAQLVRSMDRVSEDA